MALRKSISRLSNPSSSAIDSTACSKLIMSLRAQYSNGQQILVTERAGDRSALHGDFITEFIKTTTLTGEGKQLFPYQSFTRMYLKLSLLPGLRFPRNRCHFY